MLVTLVTRIKDGIENNLTIAQIKEQNPLKNLGLAWEGFFNLEKIYGMVIIKLKQSTNKK